MACPTPNCLVSDEERTAKQTSALIDKTLEMERANRNRIKTVLFFGADDSGKSAFLNQIKMLHTDHFDEAARKEYREAVYISLVKVVKRLSKARERLNINNPADPADLDLVLSQPATPGYLDRYEDFAPLVTPLQRILKAWEDEPIRDDGSSGYFSYQLDVIKGKDDELAGYFFDRLDVIKEESYIPSKQDVIVSGRDAQGVEEYTVTFQGIQFKILNVCGQDSLRVKKWLPAFEDVETIIYFVSSVSFDEVLPSDRATLRMKKSLDVFETVANNRCFTKTNLILFFTKVNLLEKKILWRDISDYFLHFPRDKNPHKLKDVKDFMFTMFDEIRVDRTKTMLHYFTTTRDEEEDITVVYRAVRNSILQSVIDMVY